MSTVNVSSPQGELERSVELPESIFDVQVNVPLLHQVVVAQLAAARQGTHDTKSRGEVSGGGRKPYRQKGTGRARQGSIRAPQFAGGGVVHGPTPRDYSQRTPKKMKAAALRSALSDRARSGRVHVVSALLEGDVPSTKTASASLAKIVDTRHVLVVIDREDSVTWKSLRNVQTVHVIHPDQLNTYDVLVSDDVVFTEAAFTAFIERSKPSERTIERAAAAKAKTAGNTKPAGEDISDAEAVKEVAAQTSSDLKAEPVFEREADAAVTETEIAEVTADEAAETTADEAVATAADEESGE